MFRNGFVVNVGLSMIEIITLQRTFLREGIRVLQKKSPAFRHGEDVNDHIGEKARENSVSEYLENIKSKNII